MVSAVALVVAAPPSDGLWVGAVLVGLWALAGTALGVRRPSERLGAIALLGAGLGAAGLLALGAEAGGDLGDGSQAAARLAVRLVACLLPAVGLHLLLGLPDGRLGSAARRRGVLLAYVAGAGTGAALQAGGPVVAWPVAALWVAALAIGVAVANRRYRQVGALDRRRMQWVGWAMAVVTEGVLVVVALQILAVWPPQPRLVALALTGLVPLSLIAGTYPRLVARIDHVLTATVSLAGLSALIVAVYVLVVVGLSHRPEAGERSLLLLSMVAAAVAALLFLPARRWLSERANRLVYGERVAPDETLRTFGQRLTRAIPLDELLLQLTESLRKSMVLASAEVWTGTGGHLDLAAGVPHREAPPFTVGASELPVVARAGISGGTWVSIWLPGLHSSPASATRVAPLAHGGALLGLIVVTRPPDGDAFTEREDAVLTEVARQVALALHNVQLDAALQASLDELQEKNTELQHSRTRIVAAGDAERRKLERNLHDGAQQHLVALAVKIRLARDAVEDDPADAIALLDELRTDLQETIQEVRALAHGIFPPLLVSGGLVEALRAAAGRSPLPASVADGGIGRYREDVESAVYFCCVEAIQNAAKHAGDGSSLSVRLWEDGSSLAFEVADDGAGFDAATLGVGGQGFVNMGDRLGAIDGSLTVWSAPGRGTKVGGRVALPSKPSS